MTADELAAIRRRAAAWDVYGPTGDEITLNAARDRRVLLDDLDKLREAIHGLADTGNHRPDCPQSEWGGTKPACDCGWEEAEDAADRALLESPDDR